MFGLGYQELLLILLLLGTFLFLKPGLFFLLVLLVRGALRLVWPTIDASVTADSPRRVWIALWALSTILLAIELRGNVIVAVIAAPVALVFSFVWLWLAGWI